MQPESDDSLLHNGKTQRIPHCMTLTLELERRRGLGRAGQLHKLSVRILFAMLLGATNHDDPLLVQHDGVDGLGLGVHHGLVLFLRVLGVDGAGHFVLRLDVCREGD